MVNPTIGLEEGRPNRLSLSHYMADRILERIRFYSALDDHELTELPLRVGATDLLCKPYVQLSPRQRKCVIIQVHPTPHHRPAHLTNALLAAYASFSRRVFGRMSVQFRSM